MSRWKSLLLAAMLLSAGLPGCALQSEKQEPVSYQRRTLVFNPDEARDWLTAYRRSRNLPAVAIDPRLTAFAQRQADAMAARNVLSHDVGGSFSSRVKAAGLDDARIGENVSYGTWTDGDAMRQWKNSPQHNANLLMPGATRFGIAVARTPSRVYWAMAVAGDPVRSDPTPVFGQGLTVRRVVRWGPPPPPGGIFSGLLGN